MATKANLVIDQGTTFSTTLTLTDENGDLINLSGYISNCQIRKHYTSSTATTVNTSINTESSVITLSLNADETSNIVAGRYVYDVEITSSANVTSRIVEGIVTVTLEVTK